MRDGDRLRRLAGNVEPPRLRLSALGGSSRGWWFFGRQPIAETSADALFIQPFSRTGRYQLSVLDESGHTAQLSFSVQN
ncbi:hypothetical protein [Pseudomonas sp. TMP25]|uniref:hypothetical protein n=1 Tax=Pseudomonas sp. TMP25 TaxID=3136561 RepID=UPI003101A172